MFCFFFDNFICFITIFLYNYCGEEKMSKKRIETEENKVVKRFIIVLLVVILCIVAIYFVTKIFVSKDLFKKDDNTKTEEVEFNYDITILGSAFNRPYDQYYILAYKKSDEKALDLANMVTSYLQKEDHLKIYQADLDDYMNKQFYDPENVNSKATKPAELKVGDYTLIKFKDGQIAKYIEGIDKIKNELDVEEE